MPQVTEQLDQSVQQLHSPVEEIVQIKRLKFNFLLYNFYRSNVRVGKKLLDILSVIRNNNQ